MSDDEVAAFLDEQANGVLSLATEDRGYGIPMSFAFDEPNDRLLMDMGFGEGSKKREFLASTIEATLTTYDWVGTNNWASVVVTGTIHEVPEEDIDEATASWYQELATDIDVAGPVEDLQWYELKIEDVSGVAVYE